MSRRAFTLLEVVIALAILGVTLVAVFDITSNAMTSHVYAKKLTVATLLARSKMVDLEQELIDQGFPSDDDEDSGDFSDDGWPSIQWRSRVIAPKTAGLSPEQLFSAVFNLPLGDVSEGGGGMAAMAALFGGAPKGNASQGGGAAGLMGALGPAAGLAQGQFTQMVDQLQKSVREVHLTVLWKEGKATETIDLVTHVVSLGPGSDRNGGAAAAAGLPQAAAGDVWVRPDNGQVVPNPQPSPTGAGMVDPRDGTQLMTQAQYQAARGGAAGAAPPFPGLPGGSARPLLPEGTGTLAPITPGGPRFPGRPGRQF